MKKGQKVEGILFTSGVVIDVGTASQLKKYDHSGAVADALLSGEMKSTDKCVAVETTDGRNDSENGIAVYPENEVFFL